MTVDSFLIFSPFSIHIKSILEIFRLKMFEFRIEYLSSYVVSGSKHYTLFTILTATTMVS